MSGTSECGEGIEAQWGGKLGKNEREKQHGEVTEESITDRRTEMERVDRQKI